MEDDFLEKIYAKLDQEKLARWRKATKDRLREEAKKNPGLRAYMALYGTEKEEEM